MSVLIIPGLHKNINLPEEEITRIEALGNYSRIYFADGDKQVVAKVLHWFEDELPLEIFVRVHRSHLVNKQFVKDVKGRKIKFIHMNNGEYIVVSKRKRGIVENSMGNKLVKRISA